MIELEKFACANELSGNGFSGNGFSGNGFSGNGEDIKELFNFSSINIEELLKKY